MLDFVLTVGEIIVVIGIICLIGNLYDKYRSEKTKLEKEAEEKETQRKAKEEQIAKEKEHQEKILNLQGRLKESPIFQTSLNSILAFVNQYQSQITGFLTEGYDDVVCVVISNTGIFAYHYKGAHGYGIDYFNASEHIGFEGVAYEKALGTPDFYGNPYEWHYEISSLEKIYEMKFNERGYTNLDKDQKISLSNVFREAFAEKISNNDIKLTNEYGFIILDFKNCYNQLQSI